MTKNKGKIEGSEYEGHGIVLLESMRRFIDARHAPPSISGNAMGSRAWNFAREIGNRRRRHMTTNVLQFLGFLLGDTFMDAEDVELPRFQGGMAYKEPGKAFHQSFYTWFVESSLSLTVNRLLQCFDVWLNQARTARLLSDVGNKIFLSVQPWMQSAARNALLSQPALKRGEAAERHEVFREVERRLQTLHAREASGSPALAKAHDVLHTIERILQAVYANEAGSRQARDFHPPSFHMIQPLLGDYAVISDAEIRREFGMPVTRVPAARLSRLFVAPGQNAASGQTDWARPRPRFVEERKSETTADFYRTDSLEPAVLAFSARGMAEEIERVYSIKPLTGFAAASRMASQAVGASGSDRRFPATKPALRSVAGALDVAERLPASSYRVGPPGMKAIPDRSMQGWRSDRRAIFRWPVALTKIEDWFEQKQEDNFSLAAAGAIGRELAARSRFSNGINREGASTKAETTSVHAASSILLGNNQTGKFAEINQGVMTRLLNREPAFRTMLKRKLDGEGRPETAIGELTFLRREEQMRPPLQNYAYAQPMRPVLEEERVVKHTREKEVVEIVRKEVETVMKSRSPIDGLSRSDYSRIADHVYSSLVRRLWIEKERSGLHF
ncbi:MAG: hypothetical protein ACKVX9_09040 [Blastocatellia bacterium]